MKDKNEQDKSIFEEKTGILILVSIVLSIIVVGGVFIPSYFSNDIENGENNIADMNNKDSVDETVLYSDNKTNNELMSPNNRGSSDYGNVKSTHKMQSTHLDNNKVRLEDLNVPVKTQDPSKVQIDSSLKEKSSEKTKVIVNLEHYESDISVEEMKQKSKDMQSDILKIANNSKHVEVLNRFWISNTVVLEVDTTEMNLDSLSKVQGVRSMIQNVELSTLESETNSETNVKTKKVIQKNVNSTEYNATVGVRYIDAPDVWSNYNTMGSNTSVAVLDTGVDPNHQDINLTEWAEFDSFGDQINTSPQDYGTHGTHVSGTVSGGNASGEYIGVAPKTQLYHGAVLTNCSNSSCTGYLSQIIGGMEWAVENDVDVISMSLGGVGYYSQFIDPVKNAENSGTIVVVASANSGNNTSGSPGNIYESTAVGATTWNGEVSQFSSGEIVNKSADWGQNAPTEWPSHYTVPTISAPGSLIKSSVPGNNYTSKSGTSMATPHVSGAIALIESAVDEELSPYNIENVLESTASKPNSSFSENEPDTRYGWGIINVHEAINETKDSLSQNLSASYFSSNSETNLSIKENNSVVFNASGSDGNIRKYMWDFNGDGNYEVSTKNNATSYSFREPGERTVRLKVIDYIGDSSIDKKNITVNLPTVSDGYPNDPDNDGNYEDVRGDGKLNVFDVQALFVNMDNPIVKNYSEYYNFSSSGEDDKVTIFDVSALWKEAS